MRGVVHGVMCVQWCVVGCVQRCACSGVRVVAYV